MFGFSWWYWDCLAGLELAKYSYRNLMRFRKHWFQTCADMYDFDSWRLFSVVFLLSSFPFVWVLVVPVTLRVVKEGIIP